jgi:hypothetical protein
MAATGVTMLLSPEQLTPRSFDHLLQMKPFSERVVALGLFRQIGLVHAHLPRSTTFIGGTEILPKHQVSPTLISTLGLKPGSFYFNRCSNLRTDIRLIVRILGIVFPILNG